jgi:hypothetical protein
MTRSRQWQALVERFTMGVEEVMKEKVIDLVESAIDIYVDYVVKDAIASDLISEAPWLPDHLRQRAKALKAEHRRAYERMETE